jgi:hypothetical protein
VRVRIARVLAIVAALIALGEWLIFLPLFAMGADSQLDRILVAAGFLALPVAAAADIAGAQRLLRHSGAASRLLALGAALQLFVEGSVAFPLFIGGTAALAAAALAYSSREAA